MIYCYLKNNMNGDNNMYQVIINNVRMPFIFYSLREVMDFCYEEKKKSAAVFTKIVPLY